MAYIFTDPLDVKLIILFIIKNYNMHPDNAVITDIFMSHEFVDYFTMQSYLEKTIENKLVKMYEEEGTRHYVLTDLGNQALDSFKDRIPFSVRERILLSIKRYKRKKLKENEITAVCKPIDELDYAIECTLSENGTPLLSLSMNAGSLEFAKKGCQRFKENPEKVYSELLRILWGEV